MTNDTVEQEMEHLKQHRQVILVRSALIGAATVLPLPGVGDMLTEALSRGLIYHIARLRYVDIDEEAVDVLLAPPEKKQRLGLLSAVGGLASLLRKRTTKMRRLFAVLALLRGIEVASQAFHMATLLDHYCAQHHRGAAIRVEEARLLRASMDEAAHTAQRALASSVLGRLFSQCLQLAQALPAWVWGKLTRDSSTLALRPALVVVARAVRNFLKELSIHRYFASVVLNFDQEWSRAQASPG